MAKISIIIPVYNSRKYLKKCLDSVCNQIFKDLEIIILDDVSTDDSLDILRSYEKNDSRVKVVAMEKNIGPGALRNIGIKLATSKYIGFVDSDDYIEPDMFLELYNRMIQNDVDIVSCSFTNEIYGLNYKKILFGIKNSLDEKIIDLKKEPELLYDQSVVCWNKLYKHDFIDNFSFPEHLKYEDYPTTINMLGSVDSIFSLDRSFYHYRVRPNSLTTSDYKNFGIHELDIFECNHLIKKYYTDNGLISIYNDVLNDIALTHLLYKLGAMLTIKMPFEEKKKLINYYTNLIEIEFPNWRNNDYYKKKRKISIPLGPYMYLLDKFFLDDSIRNETDSNKLKQKIIDMSVRK